MPDSLNQWLARLERRHPRAIDLGLERCGAVYRRLGAPRPAPRVITVAGTNGKGSTVACASAVLRALGQRVGSYTSPHLLRFNERLLIDGVAVDDAALVASFEAVEAARGATSLTYFEFTTLACLRLMAEAELDVAVLEVGLGGRLDTVNLVDANPAVITPIGLDHQQYLGADTETIGAEKAGILRPGQDLVLGQADPPRSVLQRARELGCRCWLPGRDYHFTALADGMAFRLGELDWRLPLPALAGGHQFGNVAAALTAVHLSLPAMAEYPDAVAQAIRSLRLPGRLMQSSRDPRVLLDVGHNPMAAEVVMRHLQASGRSDCLCVLGMLADKDAAGVARALDPAVARWHCAGLPGARGQSGPELAGRLEHAGVYPEPLAHEDVAAALAQALQEAGPRQTILVFGSFETVARALRHLDQGLPVGREADTDPSLPPAC